MDSLFNTYKNIADKIIPTLSTNDFKVSGMLTPEEFVKAGDYLVKNSQWSWGKNNNNIFKYLPKTKQFLILKEIKFKNIINLELDDDNNNDEWNVFKQSNSNNEKTNNTEKDGNQEFNGLIDLCDLEISDSEFSDDDLTVKEDYQDIKLYDITITYDNYYRTPRIWFHAYNLHCESITNENILKDFSIEHTNISVKIEKHPHFNLESVSVHPCKHAEAMKKLLKIELENNKNIEVHNYFTYFLKFVSCILPHIVFDFTNST